ncbi:TetR family transcriptional regulator, partial [Plantactinospora veratri]
MMIDAMAAPRSGLQGGGYYWEPWSSIHLHGVVVNMTAADGRTRTYRSELRDRQAAETRRRVVEAAIEVFGQHGYQAATFAQIARRAGVSVETVRRHGPKAAIMWAAVEVA